MMLDTLTRAYTMFINMRTGAAKFNVDNRRYMGVRAIIRSEHTPPWSCPAYTAPAGWKWVYSVEAR